MNLFDKVDKPLISGVSMAVLILISIFGTAQASPQQAVRYWNEARSLQKQGRDLEAAQLFVKSAQAEQSGGKPRLKYLSIEHYQAGMSYFRVNRYGEALANFQEALIIDRQLERAGNIMSDLTNIGEIRRVWGQYDTAMKHFVEALTIGKKLVGRREDVAVLFNNIGVVYKARGQYDRAIERFRAALTIARELSQTRNVANYLSNIGDTYRAWGQYNEAMKHFRKALAIDMELGLEEQVSRDRINISAIYATQGQSQKAFSTLEDALVIAMKRGNQASIARIFNNMAHIYTSLGQYDDAIFLNRKSITINKTLNREGDVATNFNNIGVLYGVQGRYNKALESLRKARTIDKKLGRNGKVSRDLSNIGVIHYRLKNLSKAISALTKSITLTEELRKTATGNARRDYLASQIGSYQLLISSYIRDGKPAQAFHATEMSHARQLAEKLSIDESKVEITNARSVQEDLNEKTAVLIYANSNWEKEIAQITLTRKSIAAREVSKETMIATAMKQYEKVIEDFENKQQDLPKFLVKKQQPSLINNENEAEQKSDFEKIINYYRSLLGNDSSDSRGMGLVKNSLWSQDTTIKQFGRMFYDLLIKPNEAALLGKKELIIVPDGVLAFIPFELLVDEAGRYLVETYRITYTQSMGISRQVKKRQYAKNRKPLLALGGAVYDEVYYKSNTINHPAQLAALQKNTRTTLEQKRSSRNAYAAFGIGNWRNLPWTLSEVQAISKLFKTTGPLTGKQVTENRIKSMSDSGELSQYKVIHFATHGLVLPAMPELSAIVLSQFKKELSGEDGYLRMGEIANLKIRADFVNLSACETGLGKIYNGEGVIGLTQSFLIAGAKGLSVSLWEVQDDSTAIFMTKLYQLVEEDGFSYADAITEVKRLFLKGDFGEGYKAPYYWAPFVYYGDTGRKS